MAPTTFLQGDGAAAPTKIDTPGNSIRGSGNVVVPYSSSQGTTNWALLITACIISVFGLFAIVFAKRLFFTKYRSGGSSRDGYGFAATGNSDDESLMTSQDDSRTVTDTFATTTARSQSQDLDDIDVPNDDVQDGDEDRVSMESDGGWNDTVSASSVSSHDITDGNLVEEFTLPPTRLLLSPGAVSATTRSPGSSVSIRDLHLEDETRVRSYRSY